MREIKFRAWDEENKEMVYPYTVNQPYQTALGIMIKHYGNLQQYTGLKDKNGKYIYEGDILRTPAADKWDKINYSCFEVFFHDGDANSDYNIGYSINRMHNHGSVCGGYIPSFKPKQVSKMIVVGNVYENPELLNKQP